MKKNRWHQNLDLTSNAHILPPDQKENIAPGYDVYISSISRLKPVGS